MNKISLIILSLAFSLNVSADCSNSTQSIGSGTTDVRNSTTKPDSKKPDLSSISEDENTLDCVVDLPPIQAVVGYVFVPQGWTGPIGMSYALSYPSGGGGGGIYIQVNDSDLDTEIGCGTGQNDENLDAAQTAYNHIRSGFIALDNDPTTDNWTDIQANVWLWANDYNGATYTHEFPNGSSGTFTVGPLVGSERTLTIDNCPGFD